MNNLLLTTVADNTNHFDDSINLSKTALVDQVQDIQILIDENLIIQFDKMCRFCLASDNNLNLQSIFSCNASLLNLISHFNLNINQNDLLPKKVCYHCMLEVTRLISFKQQIESADMTLRSILTQAQLNLVNCYANYSEMSQEIKMDNINNFNDINLDTALNPTTMCTDISNPVQLHHLTTNDTENLTNLTINDCNDFINMSNSDVSDIGILMSSNNHTVVESIEINDMKDNLLITRNFSPEQKINNDNIRSISSQDNDTVITWCCYICKKQYNDRHEYFLHKKTHRKQKEHERNVSQLRNKQNLKRKSESNNFSTRHQSISITSKNNDQPYKCIACNTSFNNDNDLYIHSSIHRTDKIGCYSCEKEFDTITQLKRHVRTHFLDKPYKCRTCNKGFPEMCSLTKHYRIHTGEPKEKKHVCNTCGKKYSDVHSLSIHIRKHTGHKPWICTVCGKSFIDSRLLNSHSKVHSNNKPHECSECHKRFTHYSTLVTHRRTHTGEKPFTCNQCGKNFIQSTNLLLHMRVHSGEKPYNCETCSRSFASKSTLTMHLRIHTGEKPYNCHICNKGFARLDLSAHMRTHTGEKPYKCCICTKAFKTKGQLKQHNKTHVEKKPFICVICHKSWISENYLRKHIRNKHEIIKSTDSWLSVLPATNSSTTNEIKLDNNFTRENEDDDILLEIDVEKKVYAILDNGLITNKFIT